jgi:hypothetical protein
MRKLTTRLVAFLVAGLLVFPMLMSYARADGLPRKRKPHAPEQTKAADNLAELVRRAEQAAEAAQAEARRAREQTEVMQQQLLQVTKELAALRQSLTGSTSIELIPRTTPGDAVEANPQSAIRNPQSLSWRATCRIS